MLRVLMLPKDQPDILNSFGLVGEDFLTIEVLVVLVSFSICIVAMTRSASHPSDKSSRMSNSGVLSCASLEIFLLNGTTTVSD